MKVSIVLIAALAIPTFIYSQSDFQTMVDADRSVAGMAADKGAKAAFLNFLADDGIIFRPDAVNGKDFWRLNNEPAANLLVRKMAYADVSASGLLGYTTGTWEQTSRDPKTPERKLGQYVTIWSKKPDGKFLASIDIMTNYEESATDVSPPILSTNVPRDINKRRWSAADPSMNFLRHGMTKSGLGGAFDKYASDDVRLLIEEHPPILGKKNAVNVMKRYIAANFPRKVSLIESSDMAYSWNPCEYANSQEGMERGNCLSIWKLRTKKWYLVLGVFAKVPNINKPSIKVNPKSRAKS